MQDAITQSELHSIHNIGDISPICSELTRPRGLEPAEQNQPTETLKDGTPLVGAPSLSSALIAGATTGVLSALLTILIILINTGTFHLELLPFVLGLLIGFATSFVMGFRVYEREQPILNRVLVCRMCSTDISASFRPERMLCCRCENKLRLAARRIAFVHKCLIGNCW